MSGNAQILLAMAIGALATQLLAGPGIESGGAGVTFVT